MRFPAGPNLLRVLLTSGILACGEGTADSVRLPVCVYVRVCFDSDAAAWSTVVPETDCPNALPTVLRYTKSTVEWPAAIEGALALARAQLHAANATQGLLGAEDEVRLLEAWDRCQEKIGLMAAELGEWAYYRAARLLLSDLSGGTRHLHWYERDDDRSDDGTGPDTMHGKGRVGGTDAHGRLLGAARVALEAALEASQPAPPMRCGESAKVDALLAYLHERRPHKCLIFVKQRVSCLLLTEALSALLAPHEEWPIDWACATGKVGIVRGCGSETFSDKRFDAVLANFRGSLRLVRRAKSRTP